MAVFKERRELTLTVLNQHLVDRSQVLALRTAAAVQIHIQNQRLEQVALAIIPEVVTLALTGIANDNIGQHLSKESIPTQVRHTVPGITMLRIDQVEHLNLIPVFRNSSAVSA